MLSCLYMHSLSYYPHSFFIRLPPPPSLFSFFFFNDTATTEIYTLSLHDALPIWVTSAQGQSKTEKAVHTAKHAYASACLDRKSTRLNSSHGYISYAVFCLKKKKKKKLKN